MADDVTIGHGSPTAVFRNLRRSGSDDPYSGSSFVAELHGEGKGSPLARQPINCSTLPAYLNTDLRAPPNSTTQSLRSGSYACKLATADLFPQL